MGWGWLKSKGGGGGHMNFHVARNVCGGVVINICFPARGGSCFNCSDKTIKKNSRSVFIN